MNSREKILARLRANVRETYAYPEMEFVGLTFDDPVAEFKRRTVSVAGAEWLELQKGDDINAIIRKAYPDAGTVCSNVPGVSAELNPDTATSASELDGTDVGVVEGTVACAENACIWVPMDMVQKAVCFIAERLVIIIDAKNIVSNMHDAYAALDRMPQTSRYGFGCFISGPSKTADIEQALVYGAQAAKQLTVVIRV